jgi:hypothetical protein
MKMRRKILFDIPKKRQCIECGKTLGALEGYRHPTLGDESLLCPECFVNVEISVERWGRFILWSSFNPESPDPTYIDNFPFPKELETIRDKKKAQR